MTDERFIVKVRKPTAKRYEFWSGTKVSNDIIRTIENLLRNRPEIKKIKIERIKQ